MLERHHLKGMVAHSGFYSCELCLAEGRGEGAGVDFAFPANFGATPRTKEQWKEIAECVGKDLFIHVYVIETSSHLFYYRKLRDEIPVKAYGITNYSPLLRLPPPFDIVHDVPIDEFHNVKEGVVKLAMSRLFRKNAASKNILKKFNKTYMAMRTFRDSPRQTRSLNNLPDFKGIRTFTVINHAFTRCDPLRRRARTDCLLRHAITGDGGYEGLAV